MVESVWVPENGRILAIIGKSRIRASTQKHSERVSKNCRICVSTEKWWNPCEYRKMVESGRVPGKGRLRARTKNCPHKYQKTLQSVWVPENGRIRRVPGKGRIRARTKNCPNEYLKTLESVWVREKGRIRASTEKLSGRVPKNARISVSTGKW